MLVLTSVEKSVVIFAFIFAFIFATIMAKVTWRYLPKKKPEFVLLEVAGVVAFFFAGFGFVITLAMLIGLFFR